MDRPPRKRGDRLVGWSLIGKLSKGAVLKDSQTRQCRRTGPRLSPLGIQGSVILFPSPLDPFSSSACAGYAYLQAGVITAASCILAYLVTFTSVHNVPLHMLRGFGDRDTGPLTLPGRLGKRVNARKNSSWINLYVYIAFMQTGVCWTTASRRRSCRAPCRSTVYLCLGLLRSMGPDFPENYFNIL